MLRVSPARPTVVVPAFWIALFDQEPHEDKKTRHHPDGADNRAEKDMAALVAGLKTPHPHGHGHDEEPGLVDGEEDEGDGSQSGEPSARWGLAADDQHGDDEEERGDEEGDRAPRGHGVTDEATLERKDHRVAHGSSGNEAEQPGQVRPGPGLEPPDEGLLGDHANAYPYEQQGDRTRRDSSYPSPRPVALRLACGQLVASSPSSFD